MTSLLVALLLTAPASDGATMVTVQPREYPGAINNPLKGFRDYVTGGYGLLVRQYVPWNAIEVGDGDTVERIIAHTNRITQRGGKSFGELNVKLVPRVYLDWDGTLGTPDRPKQHWPADLPEFDYDSPAFQQRLRNLIVKLGEAWDNDPRIFAIQMGLIGYWGEHHTPAPTRAQRELLTECFRAAFKHKPVLVRHTDPEFMKAGFGIYYDTFANVGREPHMADQSPYIMDQFPWQATNVFHDIWRHSPIEGEVEYNWQKQRPDADPENTFGRTPDETMRTPAYRRYMIDKLRRYHCSYLGWISGYSPDQPEVLAGAGELQKAFGYRFVLESLRFTPTTAPGGRLQVELAVRNTGSAPFYLDWPVAVGLLDPATRQPVWSAPLNNIDIRTWLPGEGWDSDAFAYQTPAKLNVVADQVELPAAIPPGEYLLALAILDREGGLVPSVRFAIENYLAGGWHPLGRIGVGRPPSRTDVNDLAFDSPAFDDSLAYGVPADLLRVEAPPVPDVAAAPRWQPNPEAELIDPWRYWTIVARTADVEKHVRFDGPVDGPAGRRVQVVSGDYGRGTNLSHTWFNRGKLEPGRYRFTCQVKGTPEQVVRFDIADGWRPVAGVTDLTLSAAWTRQSIEFAISAAFKDDTRLRFQMPQDQTGEFMLTDYHLVRIDGG